MLNKFFINFLENIGKVINLGILSLFYIPFKVLMLLEKYKLIKYLWGFINRTLITKTKIINFFNFIINIFIFIYLFMLILFFSLFAYLLILLILQNIFFLPTFFTCNRMLLFFFIYLFIFLLFCKDDFLDNFFEIDFMDLRKDFHEKPEEWHFSFNETLDIVDHEVDDYLIEYDWDYEEILLDDDEEEPDFINVEDTYHLLENLEDVSYNYNSEFLDNLYFFERWLGLSNEILDRIYIARQVKAIKNKTLQLKTTNFLQSKILYQELNNEFCNLFRFFNINSIFLKKSNLEITKIRNIKNLTKIFVISNVMLHDEVSFFIKYFKIKKLQNIEDRKKIRFTFWGSNDLMGLTSLKYKKFINYKFLREKLYSNSQTHIAKYLSQHSLGFAKANNIIFKLGYTFDYFLTNTSSLLHKKLLTQLTDKNLFTCITVKNLKLKKLFFVKTITPNFFNNFYFYYLKFLLVTYPQKIVISDEDRDYLLNHIDLNNFPLLLKFPLEFCNELLKKIIENHFRIVLKAFFDRIVILQSRNNINSWIKVFIFLLFKFYNLHFVSLEKLFLKNLYLKYRLILYKLLAKGWKNTKIKKEQLNLLIIFNKFIAQKSLKTTSFLLPYHNNFNNYLKLNKVPLNSRVFDKKFYNLFTFQFNYLNPTAYLFRHTYFSKKTLNEKYLQYFYYKDALSTNFFYNRYTQQKKIKFATLWNFKNKKIKFKFISYIPYKIFYLIEDLTYFLLYFLPNILRFKETNLKYVITNRLFVRYYKFLFNLFERKNQLPSDLFYFPFLNQTLRNANEKNLFIEQLKIRLDNTFNEKFLINYIYIPRKVIKKLLTINFIKFNVDFIFILDILKIYLFNNLKNHKSFYSCIFLYNTSIYKQLFLKNILINYKFKINNLTTFKKDISFYFYKFFSLNFASVNFLFKLEQDLNLHDFEILNSLFNRYWAIGFTGPITEFFAYEYSLVNEKGYQIIDSVDVDAYTDHLTVLKDYYPTNWIEFMAMVSYIEIWLSQKNIDDEDEVDEEDYNLFWIFLFFFWFFCRWLRFFNRSNAAAERIDNLTHHEPYTDAYRIYFAEIVAAGANIFLGKNYVGTNRSYKEHNYPLAQIPDIYVMKNPVHGSSIKKKTFQSSHTLNEYRFELDEAELIINDYFRYDQNRQNFSNKKLKWLIYGNLRSSLNLNSFKTEYTQNIFGSSFDELYEIIRGAKNHRTEYIIRDPLQTPLDSIKFNKSSSVNNLYTRDLQKQSSLNWLTLKYYFLFRRRLMPYFKRTRFRQLESIGKSKEKTPYWFRNWLSWQTYKDIAIEYMRVNVLIEDRFYNFAEMQAAIEESFAVEKTRRQARYLARTNVSVLEQHYVRNEMLGEAVIRPLRRYFLYLYQGFFYNTTLHKHKNVNQLPGLQYNLIIHYLLRDIIGSVIRNVTQYRESLRNQYADAIYYLPLYFNEIYNLPPVALKDFLKKSPDFYHLVMKNASIFSEEPFLNVPFINIDTNLKDTVHWHRFIYQNPWYAIEFENVYWPRKHRKYPMGPFYPRVFPKKYIGDTKNDGDNDMYKLSFMEMWWDMFFAAGFIRDLEFYSNVFGDPYESEIRAIHDFDDLEIPTYFNFLNIPENLQSTVKPSLLQGLDRTVNTSYSMYQNYKILSGRRVLKTFDYLGDRSFFAKESLYHRLSFFRSAPMKNYFDFVDRFINKGSYYAGDNLATELSIEDEEDDFNLYLYNQYRPFWWPNNNLMLPLQNDGIIDFGPMHGKELYNYLRENLLSPRTGAELRSVMRTFTREFIWKTGRREKSPLRHLFRPLRKQTYNRLKGEFLFNAARQIIENFYEHSDSLFEDTPNYFHGPSVYGTQELGNFESDMVDQWYEPHEKFKFEEYARLYTTVAIWPWLVRTIFKLPDGVPPLFLVDINGVPEKTKYLLKNHRLHYPYRFRDPIDADDPFEQNFHYLEEGTVARFWVYPLISIAYDYFLSLVKPIFLLLDRTRFYSFLQNVNGLGNFYYRSNEFRDGFLRDSTTNAVLLDRYKNKYLKNRIINQSQDISFIKIPFIFSHTWLGILINFFYYKIESIVIILRKFYLLIVSWFNWFDLWRNGLIFSQRYLLFTFIIFILLLYYICWVPILYTISLLRNWVDYPHEADPTAETDDDEEEDDYHGLTILPQDKIEEKETYELENVGVLDDAGMGYGLHGQDIAFDIVEYFLTFYLTYDYIAEDMIEFHNFNYMSESNLQFFMDATHTLVKNELYALSEIKIPGFTFTYNFFDIYTLVNSEFRLTKFQAPLPQYRLHFLEFLHVLTGYKQTKYEWSQELIFNRDELFNYFIEQNPILYKDLRERKELTRDNLINSKYFYEIANRNTKFRYDKFTTGDELLTKGLELNNLPNTIWYANKLFIDGLDSLNFFSQNLYSNDFFNNFLYSETFMLDLNLLDFPQLTSATNYSNNFFLAKTNLINLQYKPSEKLLPFYLRFYRSDYNLASLAYLNEPLTKNLNYLQNYLSNFKEDSLSVINPHDLFMIQPENHEGLLNNEVSLGIIANLKNYYDSIILAENFDNFSEVILDLHNLEVDNWYDLEFLQFFKDIKSDYFDWLQVVEETKEWLIYLDEGRFIGLMPEQPYFLYENNLDVLNDLYFLNFLKYKDPLEKIFLYLRQHKHIYYKLAYTSRQYIIPTDMTVRYLEEPLFPDRELYFSAGLMDPSKQSLFLKSFLIKTFQKKQQSVISNDLFCYASSLQFINLEVCEDINKILTPLHRSVNKKFSLQSSLQLYSFFNFHLISKRNLFYAKNYEYRHLKFTVPSRSVSYRKTHSIFKIFLFVVFLILDFFFYHVFF